MKTFTELRKEEVEESFRGQIAKVASKYPEGSTIIVKTTKYPKGKAAKVVSHGKDFLVVAIGNKTMNVSLKGSGFRAENTVHEGKITWTRGILADGTMQIGVFDKDKEKAMQAARDLIIFLRKNKRVKIGGDKEDTDGEPNETIAKYSEELSKLVFDDDLLDDLEPNGKNADQSANELVLNRLRDLGVNIK